MSSGSARCGWQSGREEEEEEEERRERRSFDGGQETSGVMNFSRRVSRTRTGVRGEQVVAGICSARRPECPRHSQPTTLPPSAPLPPPHHHHHGSRPLDCQQMQMRDSETENKSERGFFFSLLLLFF